jgi:hypothetical protein
MLDLKFLIGMDASNGICRNLHRTRILSTMKYILYLLCARGREHYSGYLMTADAFLKGVMSTMQ